MPWREMKMQLLWAISNYHFHRAYSNRIGCRWSTSTYCPLLDSSAPHNWNMDRHFLPIFSSPSPLWLCSYFYSLLFVFEHRISLKDRSHCPPFFVVSYHVQSWKPTPGFVQPIECTYSNSPHFWQRFEFYSIVGSDATDKISYGFASANLNRKIAMKQPPNIRTEWKSTRI